MNSGKAKQLIKESLGIGAFDHQFGDGSGEMLPSALLLKLAEECGELQQVICKCLNPQSKSFTEMGKVVNEAGHVLYFLEILDGLREGAVKKQRDARKTRHAENPKSR